MYLVLENTSFPSERAQTERRWSNFKLNKMTVNRTNNMGAATLPSYIQSYQTPVTTVRGHGREAGGTILSRVRWLSTEQTNNMGAAALPSCIRSYQAPVTPVRGLGGEGGGDSFQLIVTVQQRLCLIPFGPFFTVDAACRTNLSMSVKEMEIQSHL